jgi:CHAT domain-containing protein
MTSASLLLSVRGTAQTTDTQEQREEEDQLGAKAMMLAVQGQVGRAVVESNRYVALMLQRHGSKSDEYREALQAHAVILAMQGDASAAAILDQSKRDEAPPTDARDLVFNRAITEVNTAGRYESEGNIIAAEGVWRRLEDSTSRESLWGSPAAGFGDFLFRNGKLAEACDFYHRLGQLAPMATAELDFSRLETTAKEAKCLGLIGKNHESDDLFRKVEEDTDRALAEQDKAWRNIPSIINTPKPKDNPRLAQLYSQFDAQMNEQMATIAGGTRAMNGAMLSPIVDVFEAAGRYRTAEKWRRIAVAGSATLATNPIYSYMADRLSEPDRFALAHNLLEQGVPTDEPRTLIAAVTRKARFRIYGTGASPADALDQDEQRKASGAYFATLANADWTSRRLVGADGTALTRDGFLALQETMSGTTTRAVAQTAARNFAQQSAGLEATVRHREALNDQWRALHFQQNAVLGQGDMATAKLSQLAAEQQKVEASIDGIDAQLRKIAPAYFAILQPEPITPSAAQAILASDEAVLLVVPTDLGTHLLVVTRGQIFWQRSSLSADKVDAMVHALRCDLASDQGCVKGAATIDLGGTRAATRGGAGNRFDRRTAHELYAALIEPIADAIRDKPNLYIAATGSLTSLPFGVLVMDAPAPGTNDGDPETLRHTRWFEDAHVLVQIPSLQALYYLRSYGRRDGGVDGFAGYGDPLLAGTAAVRGGGGTLRAIDALSLSSGRASATGGLLMDPAQLRALARLPGTQGELEAMRAQFNAPATALHMEARMTETAFKAASAKGSLAHIRILALATHGIAAHELNLAEPGLVFTPPATATDLDDGYLSASEVVGLNLSGTQWVILSACNTASPSDRGESGLSGLARAFFYAGAPTLLVSHWPILDDVAATLTVDTLNRAHASGTSRAKALQQAIIAIRSDGNPNHAHPSAWAPFTLVGEGK